MPENLDPKIEVARRWGSALREHGLRNVYREVDKQDFDLQSHLEFLARVRDENDRSSAILSYSYFDDMLMSATKKHLGDSAEELCGSNRPLSASRPRLLLASGLGWLSKSVAESADIMRKIRNEFAHNVKTNNFTDQRMRGWIASMFPLEKIMFSKEGDASTALSERKLSPRQMYHIRASYVLCEGISDLYVRPLLLKDGFDAHSAYMGYNHNMPIIVKQMMCTGIYTMWSIMKSENQFDDHMYGLDLDESAKNSFVDWIERFDAASLKKINDS